MEEEISILIKDIFNAFGTLIISYMILYYFFLIKLYKVFYFAETSNTSLLNNGKEKGKTKNNTSNKILKTSEIKKNTTCNNLVINMNEDLL